MDAQHKTDVLYENRKKYLKVFHSGSHQIFSLEQFSLCSENNKSQTKTSDKSYFFYQIFRESMQLLD